MKYGTVVEPGTTVQVRSGFKVMHTYSAVYIGPVDRRGKRHEVRLTEGTKAGETRKVDGRRIQT